MTEFQANEDEGHVYTSADHSMFREKPVSTRDLCKREGWHGSFSFKISAVNVCGRCMTIYSAADDAERRRRFAPTHKRCMTCLGTGAAVLVPHPFAGECLRCGGSGYLPVSVRADSVEMDARPRGVFMVLCNSGSSVFVKELDFFRDQGGLREDWGRGWVPVVAHDVEDARRIGCSLLGARPYDEQAKP